ncbi:calcium/sodium antiporter [Plesiomonas shigelloides]|uniref:calcium/sodium antiporter n=1 Tax=Plesiomonas shigelloides TaxID=703 RepID=UPI001261C243|nr:calcium/sodium antiporter [Plesiomonas shigelloides]KAB7683178.1 calcium/sodium antiporter [Plesiomonas shigelloides]MCQ8858581.1 calcium/sodium antiporter [Plesiomonas shigelloides]
MDYLLLAIGLVLLVVGADGLVKGAARLAASIGIPSLVIGLTVVAFGTSAPELAVSIRSALAGQSEMAIANVVGSNIFNVLFILGLAAIITPLAISRQLIRQDVPLMVLASMLVFYMIRDGVLSRLDAGILVVLLLAYTVFLFVQGKRTEATERASGANNSVAPSTSGAALSDAASAEQDDEVDALIRGTHPTWQNLLWIIGGLACLVAGANLLVNSAVNIARAFAVSEAVIGLTIVAVGTSLPEVMTSIVASIKGQRDIAVGNVVGSNIFNLLAVLGVSGVLSSNGLAGNEQLVQQDFPVMLAVALLCVPLFFTGEILSRIEGALFFILYLAYTLFLIGGALHAPWLAPVQGIIVYALIPLTVVVVIGSLVKDRYDKRQLSKVSE